MLLNLDRGPQWLPRDSAKLQERRFDGVANRLSDIRAKESTPYAPTRTRLQVQIAERKQRREAHEADFQRQLASYKPFNDPKISGDPAATLFLGRMNYNASEAQIREEFAKFGQISSVRVLKGYAFVLFSSPHAVVNAIKQTAGSTLWLDHRIVLDYERARRQPFWKPRRLGGGLGGRFSLARQRQDTARSHQIQRKGPEAIAPQSRPPRSHGGHFDSDNGSNGARFNGFSPYRNRDDSRRPRPHDRGLDNRPRGPDRNDRSDHRNKGDSGGRTLRQY